MREFFQCVAEAVVENGIQGLAQMVPGGQFVYAVGESAFKKYKERRRVQQQQADFKQLANATIDEIRVELVEIVNEVAARVPAGHNVPAPTDDEIIDLVQYLSGIPEALRQSLKRAEDPTGTTLPQNFAVNSAEDIVKVLPPRPPRFRTGMGVPNKSGWVLDQLLGRAASASASPISCSSVVLPVPATPRIIITRSREPST